MPVNKVPKYAIKYKLKRHLPERGAVFAMLIGIADNDVHRADRNYNCTLPKHVRDVASIRLLENRPLLCQGTVCVL